MIATGNSTNNMATISYQGSGTVLISRNYSDGTGLTRLSVIENVKASESIQTYWLSAIVGIN